MVSSPASTVTLVTVGTLTGLGVFYSLVRWLPVCRVSDPFVYGCSLAFSTSVGVMAAGLAMMRM